MDIQDSQEPDESLYVHHLHIHIVTLVTQEYPQLHLQFKVGEEKIISLVKPNYSIGRDLSNDIVLESGTISRFHATLLLLNNSDTERCIYKLIDGKVGGEPSFNGMTVNGERVNEQSLVDGDRIYFGGVIQAIFRVHHAASLRNRSAFGYKHTTKYIHPSQLADHESTAIML